MAISNFFVLLVIVIAFSVLSTNSERLHKQIYSSIEGAASCFRRLNGTHQVGCATSDSGSVGVVQMVNDISDAEWVVLNATAGPYIVVIKSSKFYDVVEVFMQHPDNIAGILVYENTTDPATAFTHDSRCPNEYASAAGSQCSTSRAGGVVWNEKGTNLMQRDIPFPIFFLPESQADEMVKIKQCYERYNLDRYNQNGRPLCSIQMNSFMFAAVNSELCLKRSSTVSSGLSIPRICDALGDLNVYYSLFPRSKNETKKEKVTLVTARLDTASLFDGLSPGASSAAVGLITLLTAATVLSKMIPASDAHLYERNVLFTLFNGESFDYIGSQRVAYDMSHGAWPSSAPLSPANIELHVEIGQIGGSLHKYKNETTWPFYAYAPYDVVVPKISEFFLDMSKNAQEYNMSMMLELTKNLPPSSLHSFRRILSNITENGDLPEVLLVDYKEKFTNMFYQSALDDYNKINFVYHNISIDNTGTFIPTNDLLANGTMKEYDTQVKISRFATALARTLYQKVTGKAYAGNETVSAHLVDELLYCFLDSPLCRLLVAADYASSRHTEKLPPTPALLYVSVASWTSAGPLFAGHLLALLTGTQLTVNRTACDALKVPDLSHYWLRGWNHSGVCIQTTMNFSTAISPAFVIPDYDMKSGKYSTWTESVWRQLTARVFVSASGAGARAAAIAGLLSTIFSAILTYWLHKHADVIFVSIPAVAMVSEEAASGILRTVNC